MLSYISLSVKSAKIKEMINTIYSFRYFFTSVFHICRNVLISQYLSNKNPLMTTISRWVFKLTFLSSKIIIFTKTISFYIIYISINFWNFQIKILSSFIHQTYIYIQNKPCLLFQTQFLSLKKEILQKFIASDVNFFSINMGITYFMSSINIIDFL